MDELLDILSVFALISVAILTLVLVLASIGKSLGIRKLYISLLLLIFEVNCNTICASGKLKFYFSQKLVLVSNFTNQFRDQTCYALMFCMAQSKLYEPEDASIWFVGKPAGDNSQKWRHSLDRETLP